MTKIILRKFRHSINTFVLLLTIMLPSILNAQTNAADINGNGTLNILVIGTSVSIENNVEEFSPSQISTELQNILSAEN